MNFLGYIAATLIAPNLTGYLISKGLANRQEKNLVKEIETRIIEFNRSFADTEVDSNFFVAFIRQSDVNSAIFDRVFNSHRASNVDYESLAKLLSHDAVQFVNEKKVKIGYPEVKKQSDFENYFKELFKSLLEARESLLGMKERVVVSSVSDSIERTGKEITETIETKFGDSYLLEERINEIEELINSGYHEEAKGGIAFIFETETSINKEQRVRLVYQKVRCCINSGNFNELSQLRKQILFLDKESKYIDELDYWLACHEKNFNSVLESIESLRKKGTEGYKLDLKETYYYLINGEDEKVFAKLLDVTGDLKELYQQEASAYFQIGIIYLNKGQYSLAEKFLNSALKIKYHISYDYNCIVARAHQFFNEIKGFHIIDEITKLKAGELSKEHERTQYFIKDSEPNIRLQHWHIYLHLLSLSSSENVLLKLDEVDEDLIHEEPIVAVCSEALYLVGKYRETIPYLERIWHVNPIFLMRLCNCYKECDEWEAIDSILSRVSEGQYDSDGIIFFYRIELLLKSDNVSEALELIKSDGSKYIDKPWFIERVIRFSDEYHLSDIHEEYLGHLKSYSDAFLFREKLNIARTLYNQGELEALRWLLMKDYKTNDETVGLYLSSFGEIKTSNPYFDDLKQTVMNLYKDENKSEYVLHCKFYIEFETERFIDAMETLNEYRTFVGDDFFYNLNIVQCVIFGSLNYDASEEVLQLMQSNILKYHIMAAQYYSYKGRWNNAKSVLLRAFYRFSDDISEDEISGFVKLYFNNMHHKNEKVEFEQVRDDSVVTLRNSNGKLIKYCIHTNDFMIEKNGEIKFGCVNLKNTSDESLILKAIGIKNSEIEFNGEEYKVADVLDIYTYFFRYFLNKLQVEYPDNKTVIPISSDTTEGLIEQMIEFLKADRENTKAKLDFYNFGVETGTPLTYISGKDSEKYLDTVQYLMNEKGQNFYSAYSNNIIQGSKYVLTISSLVILNALGYLEKISVISDRVYIANRLKPFIRKGISDAIKYADSVVSTAFLDDESRFRIAKTTEEAKLFRKQFWTEILIFTNKFNELKPKTIDTNFYDILHEMVDISEFESIGIAKEENAVLVCDDLFISKINNGIGNPQATVNAIGLLYSEKLISIDELIEISKNLSRKRVVNCINHFMLYDIYCKLLDSHGTGDFEQYFKDVKEIFINMFGEPVGQFYAELYQHFRNMVIANNQMTMLLYELVQEPFGLKPFKELFYETWNNMKLEIKVKD